MAAAVTSGAGSSSVKVFVGNLSFKTTEVDLAKQFEQVGRVLSANIIARGARSLGYGFVEFENEDLAKKSVDLLHQKEIDGRVINVEVARTRTEGSAEARPRTANRRPRRNENGAAPAGDAAAAGARRPARKVEKKEPSKTTLFVANLPFSVTDEELKKIFDGFNVKESHVVRTAPRGRSKGYGFVEFVSEAEQQRALQVADKKVVEGRELTVRVAMSELKKEEEGAAPAAAPAAAAAAPAASPAPATGNGKKKGSQ